MICIACQMNPGRTIETISCRFIPDVLYYCPTCKTVYYDNRNLTVPITPTDKYKAATEARDKMLLEADEKFAKSVRPYAECRHWLEANGPEYISSQLWEDLYTDMIKDYRDELDKAREAADVLYNQMIGNSPKT